jgi:protocatechuate 3,4-dioxygenase beta subunit
MSIALIVLLEWCSGQIGAIGRAHGAEEKATATTDRTSKPPKGDEYMVMGRVLDASGHPIAGATVEWGSDKTRFQRRQRAKTDKDGTYTMVLKSLDNENHLAASAAGYATEIADSTISRGRQTRDFTLRPIAAGKHIAAGTVVDELNRPIPGVRVEAFTPVKGFISSFSMPTGRDYFAGPDRVSTTDAAGRFRIADLPTDEVQLNLESKHRHVNDQNYPVKEGLKIKMSGSGATGVVQGRLVDERGGLPPLSADVRIVPRYSTKTYTCDNDGRFQLPAEVTLGGKYIVYVYAKGFAAKECRLATVRRGSDEFQPIKLTIGPQLQGKLLDAQTGQPVKDAAMMYGISEGHSYIEWSDLKSYADGHHPLKFVQHVTTNKQGEFWFAEPEGNARGMIIVFLPGYQRLILKPEARDADAGGELVIRLKRESAFTGVVLRDGKPAANESLSVSRVSEQIRDNPMQMSESVHTDAQGKYRYGRLSPGQYYIHGGAYSRKATVGEGETATVNLGSDLGNIRIHGSTLANADIRVSPEFDWEYSGLSTKSNESGKYELPGLKPGKYRVFVETAWQGGFRGPRVQTVIEVARDGQEIDLRSERD